MQMDFDLAKHHANKTKHGIGFEAIAGIEWDTAITTPDQRRDYGEERLVTYGMATGRLHILVWTLRHGRMRPISFRKANKRERIFYETYPKKN